MKFIGAIAFLDSDTRENRVTMPMDLDVMTDWFQTVKDTYKDVCLAGEFDGTEILITVYEFKHEANVVTEWDYDSENLVGSTNIVNPYNTI